MGDEGDEGREQLLASGEWSFVGTDGEAVTDEDRVISKIGGVPWWPVGEPWPVWGSGEWAGKPLHFVGQVNLAELPWGALSEAQQGSSAGTAVLSLPRTGLVQLFVDDEPPYGVDSGGQNGWRFVYRPGDALGVESLTEAPTAEPSENFVLWVEPGRCLPVQFELAVTYKQAVADRLWSEFPEDAESLHEEFIGYQAPALQVGGHGFYSQFDTADAADLLVVQYGIAEAMMWADGGSAQIHAPGGALDWTGVRYTWDCG